MVCKRASQNGVWPLHIARHTSGCVAGWAAPGAITGSGSMLRLCWTRGTTSSFRCQQQRLDEGCPKTQRWQELRTPKVGVRVCHCPNSGSPRGLGSQKGHSSSLPLIASSMVSSGGWKCFVEMCFSPFVLQLSVLPPCSGVWLLGWPWPCQCFVFCGAATQC